MRNPEHLVGPGLVPEMPKHHSEKSRMRAPVPVFADTIPRRLTDKQTRQYIIDGPREIDSHDMIASRAQSTVAGEGGYTIAESASDQITRSLFNSSPMVQSSTIRRTLTGSTLTLSTTDDSVVGSLIGEGLADGVEDIAFGAVTLSSYTYRSGDVHVTTELLQDSGVDLDQELFSIEGDRLGRAINAHATTGDGSSKPRGIVTGATDSGVAPDVSDGLSIANLAAIKAALPAGYRSRASWMVNSDVLAEIEGLDWTTKPSGLIYNPSTGQPRVLGKPLVVNEDMPDSDAGERAIVFGDLSKYTIRFVGAPSMLRLSERYAEYLQTAFIAYVRADGDLVDSSAVVYAEFVA